MKTSIKTSLKSSKYISVDNYSCMRVSRNGVMTEKIPVESFISSRGVVVRVKKELRYYSPIDGNPISKNARGSYLIQATRKNVSKIDYKLEKQDKINHSEPDMHKAFKRFGEMWLGRKLSSYNHQTPIYYKGYNVRMDVKATDRGGALLTVELKLQVCMANVLEAAGYAKLYNLVNPGANIKPVMVFRHANPQFRKLMELFGISWVHIANDFSVIKRWDA